MSIEELSNKQSILDILNNDLDKYKRQVNKEINLCDLEDDALYFYDVDEDEYEENDVLDVVNIEAVKDLTEVDTDHIDREAEDIRSMLKKTKPIKPIKPITIVDDDNIDNTIQMRDSIRQMLKGKK